MDSNQYAIELVTYLLVHVVYFYELIAYMLLERNAIDSIAFFLSVRKTVSNSIKNCEACNSPRPQKSIPNQVTIVTLKMYNMLVNQFKILLENN